MKGSTPLTYIGALKCFTLTGDDVRVPLVGDCSIDVGIASGRLAIGEIWLAPLAQFTLYVHYCAASIERTYAETNDMRCIDVTTDLPAQSMRQALVLGATSPDTLESLRVGAAVPV